MMNQEEIRKQFEALREECASKADEWAMHYVIEDSAPKQVGNYIMEIDVDIFMQAALSSNQEDECMNHDTVKHHENLKKIERDNDGKVNELVEEQEHIEPVQDNEGWIKWDCAWYDAPVDDDVLIDAQYINGLTVSGVRCDSFRWYINGNGSDIIAYRIAKESQ
jgi:hypothetical protein